MVAILVDSNVIIDVMNENELWSAWSFHALAQAARRSRLVINPIIYAEISVRFTSVEDLEFAIGREEFSRELLPFGAAFLAGKAFLAYQKRGGPRRSPMPDFYIGAHAAYCGYQLLTRDAARYRTYFPTVHLISPEGGLN